MIETRGCLGEAVRRITAPFGSRSLTAAQIAAQAEAATTRPAGIVAEKWHILHDLTAARGNFGVLSATLVVLEVILTSCPRQFWLRPRTSPTWCSSPRAAASWLGRAASPKRSCAATSLPSARPA